jgi:hypothetical protein
VASACSSAATDHTLIETTKPSRVPMRSNSLPESAWLIVYASRNAETTLP